MPWALKAQQRLRSEWAADEWNYLHPEGPHKGAYVISRLRDAPGAVVAVSDWMRAVPNQIAPFVPGILSSRHQRVRSLRHSPTNPQNSGVAKSSNMIVPCIVKGPAPVHDSLTRMCEDSQREVEPTSGQTRRAVIRCCCPGPKGSCAALRCGHR